VKFLKGYWARCQTSLMNNIEKIRKRFEYVEASESDVGDLTSWYMHDVPTLLAEIERAAPLVEALEWIEKRSGYPPSFLSDKAREALARYRDEGS
jgi:hypothetical protein